MQTTLTAKQGATGRVCASRMGKEQPGNKNTDGCWQHCFHQPHGTRLPPTLQWTQPRQYVWWSQRWRENTLQEQSMGWLGYETIFFPGFGWKEWHSSLSLSGLLLSHHCKLQIHALLQHGERSSTNSSSTLQLSSFLRFTQIEHYFVSKLLKSSEHLINERNHSEHGECSCWWELWNANQSLACGFFHCVKQRLCCCSHEAWQRSLNSAALNIFLTNGAEKSLLPGNHLRHLPLNFKSLKNPEIHTRRTQEFFWSYIIFSTAPNYSCMFTDQLPG